MRGQMTRRVMGTLLALGVGAAAFLLALWAGQRRLMYLPTGSVNSPESAGLRATEPVTFRTEDRLTLGGWFVPAATGRARATVIVFNGNAGNRSYRAPLAAALSKAGLSVLLFDYRGFGGNAGSPSEEGLLQDARAARQYVAGRADVDSTRIVYFGESLGTGVAIALALEHLPAAMVLRSPYTSMADLARFHYPFLPVEWILRDRYPSRERIGRVTAPTLFIAGDRDAIVPAAQTRALHDAAVMLKELLMIRGADHNDDELLDGGELVRGVERFLAAIPGLAPPI